MMVWRASVQFLSFCFVQLAVVVFVYVHYVPTRYIYLDLDFSYLFILTWKLWQAEDGRLGRKHGKQLLVSLLFIYLFGFSGE